MTSVMGDGNEEEAMSCDRFQRGGRGVGSTVPKGNDTANSDAVTMEAEGGGWRLEVEDEKKLGRWVECEVGPNC
jgi:hypothetical protein